MKDDKNSGNSYKFFTNKDCEYYPCHKSLDEINCLFCFCPLYYMEDCGGDYTILDNNVKDCSNCVKPHLRENYDLICNQLKKKEG